MVDDARTGAEGILVSRAHKPDAVLLDLTMPQMDGFDAISRIIEVSPKSKIIVISAHDRAIYWPTLQGLGAVDYFEKGQPFDVLREMLSTVLANGA